MTSGWSAARAPYSMQDATTTLNEVPSPPPSTTTDTQTATHTQTLSNDDIEAVILAATSSTSAQGHPLPLRDTRTQLFVANLPYRVRWQDLKDLFRRAGTVLRADVSLGPDNRSRGYGTVLLATAEDAGRAVDMFSGYSWQGRVLEVRADRIRDFDTPFPEDEVLGLGQGTAVGRNLFVGNVRVSSTFIAGSQLPFHVQWQDLKDLFRQAGTIVRADVALGPDGRSRGFGTVVFATEKDARRAVGMFSG
ncbi:RNA-binding domain-containing protein, partial [Mycena sanguinolenta]